jgi:hypothetical protein
MGRPDGKWARSDGVLKTREDKVHSWAVRTETLAVRTVIGQNRFLRSFRAAHSDELADETSDEAHGFLGVWTDCERSANGALGF